MRALFQPHGGPAGQLPILWLFGVRAVAPAFFLRLIGAPRLVAALLLPLLILLLGALLLCLLLCLLLRLLLPLKFLLLGTLRRRRCGGRAAAFGLRGCLHLR